MDATKYQLLLFAPPKRIWIVALPPACQLENSRRAGALRGIQIGGEIRRAPTLGGAAPPRRVAQTRCPDAACPGPEEGCPYSHGSLVPEWVKPASPRSKFSETSPAR